MKYRIYIDEVGNPDLESSNDPNHRFLSLTGIILELGYVESVVFPQMEALKTKYFHSHPDDPVIFHRKEMVNAKKPFEVLKDDNIQKKFDSELLSLMSRWEYTVITVCLDKKNHKETYATWRYDPYHYCLAVLLERFVFFLNRMNTQGDVMAESRGGKEDKRLKTSFVRLWEQGTDFVEPEQFQKVLTSKQLKVKPKANNISGLQLADLLAHPSRNEILNEQRLLQKDLGFFAKKVIEILQKKYDQRDGHVYGKKFL
ncbi:MAG TPA: hypothetical protein DDX84_09140 [Nitrospiraceae bacterium]|nr:MAG: hypothetical protein A3D21_07030 [Nitrospirae bacterium RIFCSPHIGHO2_02_FULL_42_12]HBI24342.1 hypothetical protein [Nitrospiraceae bacterium]